MRQRPPSKRRIRAEMSAWAELAASAARTVAPGALDGVALGEVPKVRARPRQLEHAHAAALWSAVTGRWYWPRLYHWPNERKSRTEALRLSQVGVRPGPPDYFLWIARNGHPFAALELKASEYRARPTPEQTALLGVFEGLGAAVTVAHGWEQALAWLDDYAGPRPDGWREDVAALDDGRALAHIPEHE